ESGSPIKKKRAKKVSSESETTDSDKTPSKRSERKEKKADGSKVPTKKKPNDTADKREDEEKGDVRDVNEKGDLKQSEEKDGKEGSGSESEENGNSKSIIKNALLRVSIDAKSEIKENSDAKLETKENSDAKLETKENSDAKSETKENSDAKLETKENSDAKSETKENSDAESDTNKNSDAESETNENSDAKSEKKEKSDAKSESKKADNKKSDDEKTAKSSGNTGSKKSNVECITIDSDSDVGNPQNGSSSDSEGVSFKVKKRGKGQTWLDDFFKSEPVSDDSEEEKEEKVKKSRRRNIRKIVDLSKSTQDAERMEKARRKRLEQDENAPKEEVGMGVEIDGCQDVTRCQDATSLERRSVIIIPDDQSPQKKKKVDRSIVGALKPHQVEGIKFLWRNVVENVNRANRGKGDGCILAHCMGLGKTLQVIAFLHTVLHSPHLPKLRTALVVCPLGTVLNWCKEIDMWTRKSDQPIAIYNLSETKSFHERATMLKKWHKKGGVMMTGYKMFLLMSSSKKGKYKRYNHLFAEHMLQPGPDIVVCDEGHIIKNEATSLCTVMSSIKTRRRVVLTGTPLQNNLMEYYCMVNFIKPRLLGSAKEFNNRFTHPISNGQHVDSTEKDVKLMKKRSHVLHELLAGCVQRKDIDCLREQLMPKYEYVLRVRLTPLQIALYERYLSTFKCSDISNRKGCLFQDFKNLLLVVCHPKVLVLDKLRREQQRVSLLSYSYCSNPFICNESFKFLVLKESVLECVLSSLYLGFKKKELHGNTLILAETAREDIRSFLNDEDEDDESSEIGSEEEIDPPSPDELLRLPTMSVQTRISYKQPTQVTLLLRILKHSAQVGDKVVVFSQSLLTLDLIEDVLRNVTMKENDTSRADSGIRINKYKDIDYCRIDGSVKQNSRKNCIDQFNTHVDVRCRLMLVSTRAGGIGINLIGANRAIVFDASWNPTHDVQSIFRIYRFGQSKPCFVYRFIAQGTMEEKIYDRQVVKQSLAFRVVDEQQIERHYTANDIAELYTFKPERLTDDVLKTRPTPVLPKDTLLADILKARSTRDLIVSYHEHDSLLGHQAGEELSEADRRSAWDEYDRER
uniref:Transcriptional regulator ATRX n=1 Tax=Ciona savignyi TaxID=51511 RepID=H2Y5N4_CIOSA